MANVRDAKQMKSLTERGSILAGLAAEVAIAILPLLVVLMVVVHVHHPAHFFASPEWSFGAAIFFGQTLVKFMSILARGGSAAGPVMLIGSVLLVFGFAPSLVVLNMTLQAIEEEAEQLVKPVAKHVAEGRPEETETAPRPHAGPALWLQISQVILFFGAAISYMLLGTVGEVWRLKRGSGTSP